MGLHVPVGPCQPFFLPTGKLRGQLPRQLSCSQAGWIRSTHLAASNSVCPSSLLPSCERYQPTAFLVALTEEQRETRDHGAITSQTPSYFSIFIQKEEKAKRTILSPAHEIEGNRESLGHFKLGNSTNSTPSERWGASKMGGHMENCNLGLL